jgi:hypothetical protein
MPPEPEKTIEIVERGPYLECRYLGCYALEPFKKQMEGSTQACIDRKLDLLLVDITDLTDYRPTTFERHEIGIYGATLSRILSKVAILGSREQLGDQFAATVARNRGLAIQVFADRDEAVRWLVNPSASARS